MSTVRLTDRQQATLLALADHGVPITVRLLAEQMTANGRRTSVVAAHGAASGLYGKGLAAKIHTGGDVVRYEITDQGRQAAAQIRAAG